jgi:hypothetical protein
MERDPLELGALWEKEGGKGKYMTGTINGVAVVVFRNTRAENNAKAPQWRVLKSQPREQGNPAPPPMTDDDVAF